MTKLLRPAAGKVKKQVNGIFQKAVSGINNFDIRKAVDSVSTRAVVVTSGVLAAGMLVMTLFGLGFRFGYHVFMDGEFVASVTDKTVIAEAVENVEKALGSEYRLESEPSARFAIVRHSSDDITLDIIERLSDITEGVILTVEGRHVATFASSEEAADALNEVLNISKANGAVSAEFADSVNFQRTYVKKSSVLDVASAVDYLTSYEIEPKMYTIEAGENLDSVSEKLMITKEELLNRNTALCEEDFKGGTEIVINRPKKVLSVKSSFTANYTEEIPFETKTVDDPDLYEGVTNIKTVGEVGSKQYTEISSEIDGVRVACSITDETVIKQPVSQVEAVGTKDPASGTHTGSLTRPTGGIVTSRYGSRWGRVHHGVDIGGNTGDPIKAADGGTVIVAGDEGDGYGYKVIIDHGDGSKTLYAHCNELLVTAGIKVDKGDVIARVGSTGYSTGPHLHFEVIINGQSVDPMKFIIE